MDIWRLNLNQWVRGSIPRWITTRTRKMNENPLHMGIFVLMRIISTATLTATRQLLTATHIYLLEYSLVLGLASSIFFAASF